MAEEHKALITAFLRDRALHNKRTQNARYNLGIFFKYITTCDLDFLRLSIQDAEEFQMQCVTKTDDDGGIHYTRGSVLVIMGSVISFYDYLKRRKLIYSNPFREVRRIKKGRSLPKNILTEEEMSTFLKHLKGSFREGRLSQRKQLYRVHVIAELMYSTGARIHEVMNLKPEDIDFYRGVVRITDTKTGQEREGILNSYGEKILRIYLDELRDDLLGTWAHATQERLFGAGDHLRIGINAILNRESEKLTLGRFTSHSFRHAVGYHLLRGGCDIRFIQEILGHRTLASTGVYTRVDTEDLKNVLDQYHPRVLHRDTKSHTDEEL